MKYYNIIKCKLVNDFILKFSIETVNSDTPHLSSAMMGIVEKQGYYSTKLDLYNVTNYVICVNVLFNISDADIPNTIKNRYKKELRYLKLDKLTK